ncbi:hypothetical protein ACFWYW_58515 [Nonomuraea sp. NPDC059023]|uniref:hypothetical protein n=1 Tax=unclassified Nonomuraea TaxID=2593643 RepID=UPI00367C4950
MSRTDNTMPYRIQKEDRPAWTHFMRYGGAFAGIGEDCRFYEKRARQRTRLALLRGEEPEPTRHRGQAKYDFW